MATRARRSRSGRSRIDLSRPRLLVAIPGVAAGVTLLAHAGFSDRGQTAFAVLAFAALLSCAAFEPEAARRALAQPAVIALAALALLAAASAAWTIGTTGDALRWGAVIGGYAAMAACGFIAARRGGPEPLAALVVALAVIAALIGVFAAGFQEEPYSIRIGGAWRPAGPFEYPPALGFLCVAALPTGLRWMASEGRGRLAGALAVAVFATTVALISSRTVFALAGMVAVAALLWPRFAFGHGNRTFALAAIAYAITTGATADAIAGGYDPPYEKSDDLLRIVGLAVLLPAAVVLWEATRRCFDASALLAAPLARRAAVLVLVPLFAAVTAAALTPDTGAAGEPDAGFTHGRTEIWRDAIDTALDAPIQGSGALTFLPATAQAGHPAADRFAHNLVLEAWVELGWPGLLASLALMFSAVLLVVRSRGTDAGWLLAPGAIAFLAAALIDWPFHLPASAAVFALILGGLAGDAERSQPSG